MAVAFVSVFTASNEYLKAKQFLKLNDEVKNEEISVYRGQYGLSQNVKSHDIVVGDVILIEAGMKIPADCIMIDGIDVYANEAIYNEERETIIRKNVSTGKNHRENPDPFLLSQSLITAGAGRAVVCAVGKRT